MKYLFRHLNEIQKKIVGAERVYLMIDYDGTLTPIMSHPSLAALPNNTKRTLALLGDQPRCILAIVSGRSEEDVRHLVGVDAAYYIGNHGFEIKGPDLTFVHPIAIETSNHLVHLEDELGAALSKVEGIVLQNKGFTLSVHYRTVPTRYVPKVREIVQRTIRHYSQLRILHGKKVLEVRPKADWDKGTAVKWLIQRKGEGPAVYIGDDQTDEDAFTQLEEDITILVSDKKRSSRAKYYVKNPEEVLRFLNTLMPMLGSPQA